MIKGPYTIRGMSMLLKEWRPGFNLKKDMLRTLPIWIKLPLLPLHLWGETILSKFWSAIGTSLVTDECAANKLRISYTRILVEVDITQKLIEEINLKDKEGKLMIQKVEYEWKPIFCEKCQIVGHNCEAKVKKNNGSLKRNLLHLKFPRKLQIRNRLMRK